mmetsp:Transcript_14610/g.37822  ORF Transcript_14610/g.37822 Transcript_14610/m.37822 type:complete len:202 (+) Transcript_14610:79-684(+)
MASMAASGSASATREPDTYGLPSAEGAAMGEGQDEPRRHLMRGSAVSDGLPLLERLLSLPMLALGFLDLRTTRLFRCFHRRMQSANDGAYTPADIGVDVARSEHTEQMQVVAAALRGSNYETFELLDALTAYKGVAQAHGLTRAELRAMFYFAESSKAGSAFLAFLESRESIPDGDDAEIPYASLMSGLLEWKWHVVSLMF